MVIQNIERNFSFPVQKVVNLISEWRMLSPAMMGNNLDQTSMWIVGEILETLQEIELLESGDKNRLKLFEKELIDILVFLEQAMRIMGVSPDQYRAQHLVNGLAKTSGVYDQLTEVAGNLPDDKTAVGVQFIVGGIISIMRHGPTNIDALQVTRKVVEKNKRNYPPEYLSGYDSITGKPLNPDELLQQYDHVKRLLRVIRDVSGNDPSGLDSRHHQPHADLLRNFRSTEQTLTILKQRLSI